MASLFFAVWLQPTMMKIQSDFTCGRWMTGPLHAAYGGPIEALHQVVSIPKSFKIVNIGINSNQ
jgi:hypothetical protein